MDFIFVIHGILPIRQPHRTTRRHIQPAPAEQLDLPPQLMNTAEAWQRISGDSKQH